MGAGGKRGKAGPHRQGCRALPGGIWVVELGEGGVMGTPRRVPGLRRGHGGVFGRSAGAGASGTGRPRGRRQLGCRPHAAPVEPGQPRHSACGFPPLATTPGGILRRDGGVGGTIGARQGEPRASPGAGDPTITNPPGRCHPRALLEGDAAEIPHPQPRPRD